MTILYIILIYFGIGFICWLVNAIFAYQSLGGPGLGEKLILMEIFWPWVIVWWLRDVYRKFRS